MDDITIIKPRKGLIGVDLKELFRYRELFWVLALKEIKVRYKQTLIGGAWAIIQPFSMMVVFTIFFGAVIKVPSEGVPYAIFSYSGLLLWTYFTTSLSASSNSLIGNTPLISKMYCPRIIIPLSSTLVGIMDYAIASTIVLGLMFYFISPFWSSTGKPEVISVGGFLANTLSWGEKIILTANYLLSGVPPILRFLVLGIVLGSFIDAVFSRDLTWKGFNEQKIFKEDLPYDIGGGVLMVPIMVLVFKFKMHTAVATSLAFVMITNIGGVIGYIVNGLGVPDLPAYSIGYVNLQSWLFLTVTTVVMAQVGAMTAHRLPARQLKWIFIVIMFYMGLRILGLFDWLGWPI